MRKAIENRVEFMNRVYNAGMVVDIASDGKLEIRLADGTQSLCSGTENECLAFLAGWNDCARVMSNRHGLCYGGF